MRSIANHTTAAQAPGGTNVGLRLRLIQPTRLKPGMILEGVITNVAAFGAFVDIGIHQDGLVHISCLSEKFVKDTHEIVEAGDIVRVKAFL